jgi:hypothetical protein
MQMDTLLCMSVGNKEEASRRHILHLIFWPSLTEAQAQNPQRSPATPAVLFNRYSQI